MPSTSDHRSGPAEIASAAEAGPDDPTAQTHVLELLARAEIDAQLDEKPGEPHPHIVDMPLVRNWGQQPDTETGGSSVDI
ncbi:hypothetical protein OG754_40400 (plasmid) [Streptomyces decoyicus]|uniref:hypothetical protein n=1 Tax=Streptomyces decoyicus TaxID=249567 RepID=UPI002E377AF7|nr:hypothetical protein [Streptomyces decoyicus]